MRQVNISTEEKETTCHLTFACQIIVAATAAAAASGIMFERWLYQLVWNKRICVPQSKNEGHA